MWEGKKIGEDTTLSGAPQLYIKFTSNWRLSHAQGTTLLGCEGKYGYRLRTTLA